MLLIVDFLHRENADLGTEIDAIKTSLRKKVFEQEDVDPKGAVQKPPRGKRRKEEGLVWKSFERVFHKCALLDTCLGRFRLTFGLTGLLQRSDGLCGVALTSVDSKAFKQNVKG
jgi:hypothetical protein